MFVCARVLVDQDGTRASFNHPPPLPCSVTAGWKEGGTIVVRFRPEFPPKLVKSSLFNIERTCHETNFDTMRARIYSSVFIDLDGMINDHHVCVW